MESKQTKAVITTLITRVIWGFSFLFTRTIVVRIHFLNLLSWRFFLAFLTFLVLIAFKVFCIDLRGKKIRPLIAIAVAEPLVFFTMESIGLYHTSATEASLLIATIPIASMLIGIPIAKQVPTKKQALSIILTVVGVLIIVLGQSIAGIKFDISGYLALSVAVFSAATCYSLSAKYCEYSSAEKTFVMMIVGTIGFGSAALTRNLALGTVSEWLLLPFHDREFLIAVLYLGVLSSVIAYVGQHYSISVLGLNRNVSFAGLTTLTTVLAGILILNEELNVSMLVGGVIVLAGVYGANYFTPQREKCKSK
ncbi:MAG TPA: DMT family transporter [Clostridiaceae bacterium]|nr:DMT family transporter [Clostridiaceae bacterium]